MWAVAGTLLALATLLMPAAGAQVITDLEPLRVTALDIAPGAIPAFIEEIAATGRAERFAVRADRQAGDGPLVSLYNIGMAAHVYRVEGLPDVLWLYLYEGTLSPPPSSLRNWAGMVDDLCRSDRVIRCNSVVAVPSRGARLPGLYNPSPLATIALKAGLGSGAELVRAVARWAEEHDFATRQYTRGDFAFYSDDLRITTLLVSTEARDELNIFILHSALMPSEDDITSFVDGVGEAVAGSAGIDMTVTLE